MKMMNFLSKLVLYSVATGTCTQSLALEISPIPLFAGGGAKPNVLFIIDDSGSMQSSIMKTPDAFNIPELDGLDQGAFLVAPFPEADDFDTVITSLSSPTDFFRGYSNDLELSLSGGVVLSTVNTGYWGNGFADFPGSGGSLKWAFNSLPIGASPMTIRYSNGSGASRSLNVLADGVSLGNVAFPPTADWNTWANVSISVPVNRAAVYVELRGLASPGPNIDSISLRERTMDSGLAFLSLCPGANLLAFNPNNTYFPWDGQPNSSYPNAQKIPFQPSLGTTNLSTARYVSWEDDGDGVYEFGECGAYVSAARIGFTMTKLKRVSDLSAEQQRNYANWYTYHRTREYAVKAGLSNVLANLRVRAGLSTIHIHNQTGINWGLNIRDVDNFSNSALQPNKDALMAELYDILSVNPMNFGGTPLRRTLENAGLYFHLDNAAAVGKPETGFLPTLTSSPFLPANAGGSCQSNHMVLVTDGFQFEYEQHKPRFTWGNVDGAQGGLFSDTLPETLADIAMYFATTDAAPNIPGDQFVHTHTLGFGVAGSLTGYPTTVAEKNWPVTANKLVGTPAFPFEYQDSLDDVMHAAFNGGGRFMTATDAKSLNSEMKILMASLSKMYKGTATAISFDRQGIAESTMMFRTLYDMENWSGHLNAYNFTASTATVGTEKWEASARLALRDANNQRKVVTFNGVKGAPFKAPANINAPNLNGGELSAAQLNDLLTDRPVAATAANYLQDMIEYLRGDGDGYTTNPSFRVRNRLGDIVNSSPVFVGTPDGFYPDNFAAKPYNDFLISKNKRTPIVYVGANDGMLHAFNANNGDEVFAYIPQGVFSNGQQKGLHFLADESYFHLPYVDETPVTGDVYINNEWRSYLVGGLGRGGKSIYVLDITDPASFSTEANMASNVVVTEFTDANMGYSFGKPKIAKLNDGEWVAIFGNGYNNNADGKAYLYVLYLDGSGPGGVSHVKLGPLGGATMGTLSGAYCENTGSDCNGLSEPTIVDLDVNGTLDRVYAGDLFGNVWAFDFTKDTLGKTVSSSNATSVVPVVAHKNIASLKIPLFTACRGELSAAGVCAVADRQPITTKPTVAAHSLKTSITSEPNLMVYFGTGQYLSELDILNLDVQSFYGVWDGGGSDGGLKASNLTAQSFQLDANGNRTMSSVNAVPYIRNADAAGGAGNYGWRLALTSGEKVIENPNVVNDVVIFPTRITSNDMCNRNGTGFIMGVDNKTGGKPPSFQVFPGKNADIGIPELSGGELVRAQGAPLKWFAPDPDNDSTPASITINTEPKRAPRRSSWNIKQ